MQSITQKLIHAYRLSADTIRAEGPSQFIKRASFFTYYRIFPEKRKGRCRDILFINGCTLPHPSRYRVEHQAEQLRAAGLTVDTIFYTNLSLSMMKYYRGFIFFRCPVTSTVEEFIAVAKSNNKACFFDIDDLVIDKKYTDQIKYVREMSDSEKAHYDDGVKRMKRTFELCDYTITTTQRLQKELTSYGAEVVINRNVASDEMVRHSLEALSTLEKDEQKIILGYFSGSITHNEDFDLITPTLLKLFQKHKNLYLKVAGHLDIPEALKPYEDRLMILDFMDWRSMPKEIASCDINLAPLVQTIFNEAKSENKWLEAGLVRVPTVASKVGAFEYAIQHGQTGFLVEDDQWYEVLDSLITDEVKREKVAFKAQENILHNHTTIAVSSHFGRVISERLARNIAFVLPSTDISGGINVVLKHAEILRKNGWDVSLIDCIKKSSLKKSLKQYNYRLELPGYNVLLSCKTDIQAHFDTMVATLWSTLRFVKEYPETSDRLYFVQNYETDFYNWGIGIPKILANATYSDKTGVKYITMSLWCKAWLKSKFNQESKYASNGLDLNFYPVKKRSFTGKIKLLVEGDSKSEYKNTDEAFRIIEKLHPDKFEVCYLSYRKEPKPWYRVDHFYNRIPPEQVGKVYAECDILIKTSLLESFSYPPLEMMATGGLAVVLPNDGNAEYLRDRENCLFYKKGDIDDGVAKVYELIENVSLRSQLIKNGLKTAQNYSWSHIESDILNLYQESRKK